MGVITTATGEELLQLLAALDAKLAGMTTAEAAEYLGLKAGKVASTYSALTAPGEAIVSETASAIEAYNAYIAAGGAVEGAAALSQSGAAAAGVAEISGAGGATAAGILSLSVPAAAAAAAPLLGVAIGAGLYTLAPDFWTKISDAIFGTSCYEGTQTVPAVVDKNGQVYIGKDVLDALKGVLSSLEKTYIDPRLSTSTVPINYATVQSVAETYMTTTRNERIFNSPVQMVTYNLSGKLKYGVCSKSPIVYHEVVYALIGNKWVYHHTSSDITVNTSYTYDGKTIYYYTMSDITDISPSMTLYQMTAGLETAVFWSIQYGEKTYPEGISKYTGNTPVDYTQNKIDVVTDPTDITTQPYYPIRIPIGDPGVTTSPLVDPNPQSPSTAPQITPYVSPEVSPLQYPPGVTVPTTTQRTAPIDYPVPNVNPTVQPSTDPSSPPTDIPPSVPAPPAPPISGGNSPPTLFPPIGEWPSIVPSGDSGLIHVYNPTPDEMIGFGKWLWVTYADATIEKIWNNPFDGVISAHELYATPAADGSDNIRSGFLVCPTVAPLVRVRYTTINCGSIAIPEHYANYLDYSPYSKAHVYLPFIGIVELNVDDIVGHGVNIAYHIDAYNGSCIAQITVAKKDYTNTVYQFSGNCAVELPLAGGSQAAIKAGMIAAAATGISSVVGSIASGVTGNIGGAVSGAAYGVAGAVSHAVSQKSSVQHSGSFGASYGAMGIKKPYIIIHRPIQKEVVNYNQEYGYPAHKRVVIGNCEGYLRVREVHVQSQTATDDEKALIEKKLKEGVFVT